jgi:hypothetical protein
MPRDVLRNQYAGELLAEDYKRRPNTYSGQLLAQDRGPLPSLSEIEALQLPEEEDFARGLRSAAAGLGAGTSFREADKALALYEEDNTNRRALREAEDLRRIGQGAQQKAQDFSPRVGSFTEVNGVGDTIDYLQGGLGTLTPTMVPPVAAGIAGTAAGFVVGGPVGAAIGGAAAASIPAFQMEAGEQASSQQGDEFIRNNTTAAERLREQNIKGGQNALLEAAFPAVFGGRLVSGAAKRIVGEIGENAAKKTLGRTRTVLREGALESGTELTQTLTGQASLTRLNPNRDTTHDYIEQIDSIILGALGGTSISLGTTVPGFVSEKLGNKAEAIADSEIKKAGEAVGGVILDSQLDGIADSGAPVSDAMMKDSQLQAEAEQLEGELARITSPDGSVPLEAGEKLQRFHDIRKEQKKRARQAETKTDRYINKALSGNHTGIAGVAKALRDSGEELTPEIEALLKITNTKDRRAAAQAIREAQNPEQPVAEEQSDRISDADLDLEAARLTTQLEEAQKEGELGEESRSTMERLIEIKQEQIARQEEASQPSDGGDLKPSAIRPNLPDPAGTLTTRELEQKHAELTAQLEDAQRKGTLGEEFEPLSTILRPASVGKKGENIGNRRYSLFEDLDSFIEDQLDRVLPSDTPIEGQELGQFMLEREAGTFQMRGELEAITRDLLETRNEHIRKSKTDDRSAQIESADNQLTNILIALGVEDEAIPGILEKIGSFKLAKGKVTGEERSVLLGLIRNASKEATALALDQYGVMKTERDDVFTDVDMENAKNTFRGDDSKSSDPEHVVAFRQRLRSGAEVTTKLSTKSLSFLSLKKFKKELEERTSGQDTPTSSSVKNALNLGISAVLNRPDILGVVNPKTGELVSGSVDVTGDALKTISRGADFDAAVGTKLPRNQRRRTQERFHGLDENGIAQLNRFVNRVQQRVSGSKKKGIRSKIDRLHEDGKLDSEDSREKILTELAARRTQIQKMINAVTAHKLKRKLFAEQKRLRAKLQVHSINKKKEAPIAKRTKSKANAALLRNIRKKLLSKSQLTEIRAKLKANEKTLAEATTFSAKQASELAKDKLRIQKLHALKASISSVINQIGDIGFQEEIDAAEIADGTKEDLTNQKDKGGAQFAAEQTGAGAQVSRSRAFTPLKRGLADTKAVAEFAKRVEEGSNLSTAQIAKGVSAATHVINVGRGAAQPIAGKITSTRNLDENSVVVLSMPVAGGVPQQDISKKPQIERTKKESSVAAFRKVKAGKGFKKVFSDKAWRKVIEGATFKKIVESKATIIIYEHDNQIIVRAMEDAGYMRIAEEQVSLRNKVWVPIAGSGNAVAANQTTPVAAKARNPSDPSIEDLAAQLEVLSAKVAETKPKGKFLQDADNETTNPATKDVVQTRGTIVYINGERVAKENLWKPKFGFALRFLTSTISSRGVQLEDGTLSSPIGIAAELKRAGVHPDQQPKRVVLPKLRSEALRAKDQDKSDAANKFIGRGKKGSSTAAYARAWGVLANTGKYVSSDSVFISVNGRGLGRLDFDKAEVKKAITAKATLIADKPGTGFGQRDSSHNALGEGALAAFIAENGYEELGNTGVWEPRVTKQKNSPSTTVIPKRQVSIPPRQQEAYEDFVEENLTSEEARLAAEQGEAFDDSAIKQRFLDSKQSTPKVEKLKGSLPQSQVFISFAAAKLNWPINKIRITISQIRAAEKRGKDPYDPNSSSFRANAPALKAVAKLWDLKPSQINPPVQQSLLKVAKRLEGQGKRIVFSNGEWKVIDKQGKLSELKADEKQLLTSQVQEIIPVGSIEDALKRKEVKEVEKWLAILLGPTIAKKAKDEGFFLWQGLSAKDRETRTIADYSISKRLIRLAVDATDPLSLVFHESMHDLWEQLGTIPGGQAVHDRLAKLAMAPHVQSQMKKLLGGEEDAIAQLAQPDEAVAYMFQFWAASQQIDGAPTFNIQPAASGMFKRLAKFLAEVLGFISEEKNAQLIFEAFVNGDLNNATKRIDFLNGHKNTKVAAAMSTALAPLRNGFTSAIQTPINRLYKTKNKALMKIADGYFSSVKEARASGILQLTPQMAAQFDNNWQGILVKHSANKQDVQKMLRDLQSQQKFKVGTLAGDMQRFFRGMYNYASRGGKEGGAIHVLSPVIDSKTGKKVILKDGTVKTEWQPLNKETNYFPRYWDVQQLLANKAVFSSLVIEEAKKAGQVISEEEVTDFVDHLKANDGTNEISSVQRALVPAMAASNPRVFTFINESNAASFVRFQERNFESIMSKYVRQTVHRREHGRMFGHDGQRINDLIAEARATGATEDDIQLANKAIDAMDGTLGTANMTALKRNTMTAAITAVNFAVLPLATFTSLVDPLGVLVRTGSLVGAARTFKEGLLQIKRDFKGQKSEMQKLAEYLGIISEEMMLEVIGNTYNGMFMNQTLRKLNTHFFKLIGLEQWTRGTRVGALQASMLYMLENKDTPKVLKELNLQKGDIVKLTDSTIATKIGEIAPDFKNLSPEQQEEAREKARRIQNAVFRMVDESILRPSAAVRPIWMSDIRFMLLGHLKQFTFTFHNVINRQTVKNFQNEQEAGKNMATAALQFMPLLSYIPMIIAADMLRNMVAGRWDDDDDDTFTETMLTAMKRSSVLGYGTFALDVKDDLEYSSLPVNTFLGPVIDSAFNVTQAAFNPDADLSRASARLLPGNALWRGWLD